MKYGTEHALNQYKPEFCDTAVSILGAGKSIAALAAALEVSCKTIDEWRKRYDEFGHAVDCGRARGQAYWENESDSNMHNKDYASTRYIFKMKSQYKLRDNDDASVHVVTPAEDSSKITEIMRDIANRKI